MPLYEYTCQKCQHAFEALVFDGEAVQCPECQGERVERLLSLPAKPQSAAAAMPMRCEGSGPPCGAPGCRRTG
ncbi:MAG TPA: zinc ribbon domain-containing protein [Gemmataceae bacterium]|nr:zinc ribbon domain-containing protein [Gemmataceae bacterium]